MSSPQRSLGIVTLNQAQREVLTEEMDRLFAHNEQAETYRKRWEDSLEPFFVKNLENVQGDERDVVFISTVYGPEQRGNRVAQRFGPINAAEVIGASTCSSPAPRRRLSSSPR